MKALKLKGASLPLICAPSIADLINSIRSVSDNPKEDAVDQ